MHRVRMSLPYFNEFGWEAEVVTVVDSYSQIAKDELLLQSLPNGIKIHKIKALSRKITAKIGLGSLALRSLWYYHKKVNIILKEKKIDLIYFSTTEFPVCILGSYWKKKFDIPYVIDMQDPWHSEYYQDKPKDQRPPKYWFSYRLHKKLEPIAMRRVDGLISVSSSYIDVLKARYPNLRDVPTAVITFGAFRPDLKIALDNRNKFESLLQKGFVNIVYVGRGGADMHGAIKHVFDALKNGLNKQPELFGRLRLYFIGTSYAPAGQGRETIMPLAKQFGLEGNVIEHTDRISYYHALLTLQQADALFIPGSDDPAYSASKLYPYLMTQKPLLAIFNRNSNVPGTLKNCALNANVLTFGNGEAPSGTVVYSLLTDWSKGILTPAEPTAGFEKYSARNLTGEQVNLFNLALQYNETKNSSARRA